MTQSETKKQSLILTRGEFPVIDLRQNYGHRFRVRKDECGDQLIPHKWGHFYAHSDAELACFVDGNRKFNLIHEQFPEIRVTQRGDQEIIFVFDPALLPKLAPALKAARRKQYSPEQLVKMRERMLEARKHLIERPFPDRREEIA